MLKKLCVVSLLMFGSSRLFSAQLKKVDEGRELALQEPVGVGKEVMQYTPFSEYLAGFVAEYLFARDKETVRGEIQTFSLFPGKWASLRRLAPSEKLAGEELIVEHNLSVGSAIYSCKPSGFFPKGVFFIKVDASVVLDPTFRWGWFQDVSVVIPFASGEVARALKADKLKASASR